MALRTEAPELRPVNPATLEEVGAVPVSSPEEVAEAVAAGVVSGSPGLLAAVAREALDRADELTATVTAETGKPLVESYTAELWWYPYDARMVNGLQGWRS